MVEKLSVQVALDGADQVVSAFESIEQGAAAAIGNITNMAEKLLSAFGPVGELVGGAAASFAGFAVALERLTVSAAESAAEIRGLAIISGTSAEEMSALVSAFSAAGVSTEGLLTNFRRLAQAVSTELPKVRKEMVEAGDTIASAQIKANESTNALNKVMGESATYNLHDIEIKKAQIAATEALRAAREAEANDINKFVKYFDDLAKGVKTSTDGMNLSLDNLKKGLVGSLGGGIDKLKDFQGSLRASADPSVQAMLLKLADIFHNMPDGINKTALAVQLFGRSAGPGLIAFLSQGSAAIEDAKQHVVGLGLTLNDTEQGALKRFRVANFELADTLDRLKEKFAAAVSPAFTQALQDANKFLEEHTDDIVKMGEMTLNILTKLGEAWTAILPAIKLFGAAIGYASDAGAKLIDWGVRFTDWLTNYLVRGLTIAVDWVNKLIDAFLRLIGVRGQSGTPAPAGAPDAGGLPMASGGFVRGPGGGDVIPALLSAGEFVMSRRAVARWGAGLMQSLNMGSGMPRFAAGGLVPAMASGGAVGGGRTFTINFGGETFGSLSGPDAVLERLEHAAVRQQLSSAGRKPSWKR